MLARTTSERVETWNQQYPIGTPVEYVSPMAGDRRRGRTRSRAVERDGLGFVLVEGCDRLVQLGDVLVLEHGLADMAIVDAMAEAATAAIDEEWRVQLQLETLSAFALLGALQLVLRHPLLGGEAAVVLRRIAWELQAALPRDLGEMADLGWDPNFDAMAEPIFEGDGRVVMEA